MAAMAVAGVMASRLAGTAVGMAVLIGAMAIGNRGAAMAADTIAAATATTIATIDARSAVSAVSAGTNGGSAMNITAGMAIKA